MKDRADRSKVTRIVQAESGHTMKRVYNHGTDLRYKDVELTQDEKDEQNTFTDVPY